MTMEIEGTRCENKTWWDCVKPMKSLGLSSQDTQGKDNWRVRIKWATA